MLWRKFNGDPIQLPIKNAVEQAIKRETSSGFHLKVCIGTDSQVKGKETEFATVIVFLREGRGGFMFIHNEKTLFKYSIKDDCILILVAGILRLGGNCGELWQFVANIVVSCGQLWCVVGRNCGQLWAHS